VIEDEHFNEIFAKFEVKVVDVKQGGKEMEEVKEEAVIRKKKEVKEKLMSNKEKKQMSRISIFDLKMQTSRPDLVENWDVTAPDPIFLVKLKQVRNSVPVPKHWNNKRRYLQYKRGVHKKPF
jgi:splicing factor 3B subunit 2